MRPEAWMDSDIQEIRSRLQPLPCTLGWTRCSAEHLQELGQSAQTCREMQLIKPGSNHPRWSGPRERSCWPPLVDALDPWNGTLPGWTPCGEPTVWAAITPAWGWSPLKEPSGASAVSRRCRGANYQRKIRSFDAASLLQPVPCSPWRD